MIPQELIKKIRQIEIYTSKAVDASFAGQYESVFKGRGMAFDEVREYVPGDDIRTIDWNVTARIRLKLMGDVQKTHIVANYSLSFHYLDAGHCDIQYRHLPCF
jgi:hypothetical protein